MKIAIIWTSIKGELQNDFFELSYLSFLNSNNNFDSFLFVENKTNSNIFNFDKLNIFDFDDIKLDFNSRNLLTSQPLIAWTILPFYDFFSKYDKLIFIDNDTLINFDLAMLVNNINLINNFTIASTKQFQLRELEGKLQDNAIKFESVGEFIYEDYKKPNFNPLIKKYIDSNTFRFFLIENKIEDPNLSNEIISNYWEFKSNGGIWIIDRKKYMNKLASRENVLNFHFDTYNIYKASELDKWYISDEDFIFLNFWDETFHIDHFEYYFNISLKDLFQPFNDFQEFGLLHFIDTNSKNLMKEIFSYMKQYKSDGLSEFLSIFLKIDFVKLFIDGSDEINEGALAYNLAIFNDFLTYIYKLKSQ